jgi:hypothetical protein
MPYNARVTSKQTQMNIPTTLEDKTKFCEQKWSMGFIFIHLLYS